MRRAVASVMLATAASTHVSEVWTPEQTAAAGYQPHVTNPLPQTYIATEDLPDNFNWANVNGTSFVTKSLNQHIPQYCGSCWAHGAASALADRVKIAREAKGVDVNLAVQHILNCGNAGSCHGGSASAVYHWIKGNKDGIVYDTCQPYLACSSESDEGFCGSIDTTCKAENICRTCSTFSASGGFCSGIDKFPNVTIAEHGDVTGEDAMMKEIYARGSLACGVDAEPLHQYKGGVIKGKGEAVNHIISVTGWGVDNGDKYWVVRNSWGEFWGEMSYARVSRGEGKSLQIEDFPCSWATPNTWTEHNFPCGEDATDCNGKGANHGQYVDPSATGMPYGKKYAQ